MWISLYTFLEMSLFLYVTIYDTTQNFFTILTVWTKIVQTAIGVDNTLKMWKNFYAFPYWKPYFHSNIAVFRCSWYFTAAKSWKLRCTSGLVSKRLYQSPTKYTKKCQIIHFCKMSIVNLVTLFKQMHRMELKYDFQLKKTPIALWPTRLKNSELQST